MQCVSPEAFLFLNIIGKYYKDLNIDDGFESVDDIRVNEQDFCIFGSHRHKMFELKDEFKPFRSPHTAMKMNRRNNNNDSVDYGDSTIGSPTNQPEMSPWGWIAKRNK